MMQQAVNHYELLRVVLGLILILLIILALSWLVRRLQQTHLGGTRGFQPLAHMILGPKEKLVLIKAGERYLLLGHGAGQISLLCDFKDELPKGFEPESKPSFADLLKAVAVKRSV